MRRIEQGKACVNGLSSVSGKTVVGWFQPARFYFRILIVKASEQFLTHIQKVVSLE